MARKKPIISSLGQWAYPGEVTIIPSSKITMKGVNYPVLGVDDLGNSKVMMPGAEYDFPGNYVTEIPQMGKGGLSQWFDEKWVDVKTGKTCGRSGKDKDGRPYPACRPSKRVNETTPKTTSEMSSAEKARFKREKTSGKRIDYNHKRRQVGGEWLDDEPEVNPKIGWNSGNRYSYDKKGNLIYTNHPLSFDYGVEQFIERAINNKSSWLGNSLNDYELDFLKNAKNKIQNLDVWPTSLEFQVQTKVDKLNPSLDELINVTQNIYPDQYAIDNSFSKASKSRIDLPASAFENDIKERYVIPEVLKNSINKRFGTLPTTRDDSYSPNRIWTTKVKNDEDSNVGARFAIDEDNSKYAYILTPNSKKTSDLSKEKINTKKENIENLLSSADNKFYENLYLKYPDYIQYPGNYNNPEISLFGDIKNILPNQMWNRAEQMRVEMLNNPEIKDWADLHNVNLSRGNEDSKQNLVIDGFAPKVPESVYANRLVKAGLPVSTPDYDYGSDDTYIVQDPSKFNLAGYFPIPKDYDEENAKQLIAKKLGIKQEQLNSKDYLIHYNQTPITEYTPSKKYGGWLEQYQSGGLLSKDDYDLTTAPKRGDYLLPDINRPYYIDDAGERRSEWKIGINVDGKETLIPTVVGGRQLTEDEARDRYRKTGLHMGQFNTPEEADYAARLRTARYKMLEDPVNFKANQFQVGGVRRPIYTSNSRDPRIGRYRDSLNLYNASQAYNIEAAKILKSSKTDAEYANRMGYNWNKPELESKTLNDTEAQQNKILIKHPDWEPSKNIEAVNFTLMPDGYKRRLENFIEYKKPVQPYIYKKPEVVPEVVETPLPVAPAPVVEPPKPSLFVSNIDRDMYTPNGGMAREYNIGVTLQDGSKKAFRTEKEYQDWKAANNLDISKAKVSEGRGYSYNYPENKKYGGWLNKYQDAGEVPSDIERMQGVDIRKKRSWSDKLRGYVNQFEKKIGLDPYNERSDDFMEQWARRVNTATGGRDWYKQANDASGTGGIGTAMMETVMAPFSAPQLASVYGATGKVQRPSEALNIQNPVGAFLTDAVLDPVTYIVPTLRTGERILNATEKAIPQAVSYASKLAKSQIIKNPRLALSLQRSRPVSLDNVNTISGIRYGDIPFFSNNVSENNFFKQLEKGSKSLDNSINKRVADLESEEGFRRLVEQEKAYLFDNTDTDLSVIDRIAKLNAKARIEELKNTTNINKQAAEYANTNYLGSGKPNKFVSNSDLYNNAYYQKASLYDQFVKSSGTLNLKKPTPNYSKAFPGEIGMGYNYVGNVPTEMHEIGHALQRGRILSLDNGLKNIVPKKELNPINQRNYKYFKKGSSGEEPTAFANELREAMFQKGFIPDYYTPINQKQIQDAYKYFKKNPMGIYDKNTGSFASSTRIFDFMEPNKANSKLLTDVLNRLPALAPLGVGAAAASQLPEQKKGGQTSWLNKYK